MSNLFKKAAVFTDIHFGLKSNSIQHNRDCSDFVDWFIDKSKEEGCETCLFLGDWNHHRASINMHTLQFGLNALEKLNDAFEKVYFITGNHDLYYRDKRDIHSVEWAKHLKNVVIVDHFIEEGNCVIAPWLCGDDYKLLKKKKGKYLFAHLELPHFYMNAMIEMPDHGETNADHLSHFEKVFSGHFHKRQARKNIWYMGNAFPHNYRVYKLSEVLDNPEGLLIKNAHVRVHLDIDISYEESNFIREQLIPQHELREMSLIPVKSDEHAQDLAPGEISFESVDSIIIEQIKNIESDFYDKGVLLEIYQSI